MTQEEIIQYTIRTTEFYFSTMGVQIRRGGGRFYFISPLTGVHSVAEKRWNKRAKAHLEGFIQNQR
jgi:hypothetical protein